MSGDYYIVGCLYTACCVHAWGKSLGQHGLHRQDIAGGLNQAEGLSPAEELELPLLFCGYTCTCGK